MATNDKLGWALIGCGGAGNGHARYASDTPDVEVRGFCDVRSDSAKNFHEQYGGDYYTTDPDRIFSDSSVDIVSIATSSQFSRRLGDCCLQCWEAPLSRETDGDDNGRLSAYL